jgi:hypothetical protein
VTRALNPKKICESFIRNEMVGIDYQKIETTKKGE